ncbi:Receptor protein-tyrosine kinase cepr1 [Ranunculus cassubicifolius]
MGLHIFLFFLIFQISFSSTSSQAMTNQSHFFTLMKKSLSGGSLSRWNLGENSYCNYTGVTCDFRGYVVKIDLAAWSVTGQFPDHVCSFLPELRSLRLGHNRLRGNFPISIINCTFLEELNLTSLYLSGTLPNLSSLKSLRTLDLSYNRFTGDFPLSIINLTNLEDLNFNENGEFNLWKLPAEIAQLAKLKNMILSTCMLHGEIPASIGNITSLVDLELSGNFLVGRIPKEIGKLENLLQLELYYNQHLSGEIPDELGNLTRLTDVDLSVNQLTGKIPESLCKLSNLHVLQLYNNSLSGEIPSILGTSKTLHILSLYSNFLTGDVPKNLGESSEMVAVDLSENRLSGELPRDVCKGGKLLYFCVLQNLFSGELPETYGNCKSLLRFRVSYNRLQGPIPAGLLTLPHASIIDLAYNHIDGPLPKTIGDAKNLSELLFQSNRISGVLPPEISRAGNLVKIDLSNNLISGPIPPEIGNLRNLNLLLLQDNKLNSSIPESLSSLKALNVLDLSNNLLTGDIPESICDLLPSSINFANNRLSGSIPRLLIRGGLVESLSGNPGLCVSVYLNSTNSNFPVCSKVYRQKKINTIWLIGISVVVVIVGILLFLKRWLAKERSSEQEERFSSASFLYDIKSFHKITFDQREILEALVDKNIVGHGGSGTVYKIDLSNGQAVAVKKLWTQKPKYPAADDELFLDNELKTEVQTLGSIRHKNIVKLYSYYSSWDLNLLVYEYMPNGNLWDALHRGRAILDWPTRYNIALGIAQGMAYLHHDLLQPIIHRDIKSTNILLNADFQPKVADFGVAKVMLAKGKDSSTTVIAGTYGYLAPEYAYTSKATTKCDVYSFGVVLMELITGKKPVEAEFGESKNIIYWVSCKVGTRDGVTELLDKRISGSFKDEMKKVLRIAILCTCSTPALRPTMKEAVQMLIEADPCSFECCKSSNKIDEPANDTKIINLSL